MERWQLHPSGINVFDGCGEKYRRRYLEKDRPRGRSTYLIMGSAVDSAVNADLQSKMRTGKLLPESDVLDIARDSVNNAFTDEVDMPPAARLRVRFETQERTRRLVEYAHRKLCPPMQPKSIQRPWSIRLDTFFRRRGLRGMKVDLVGTLDVEEYIFDFTSENEPAGTIVRDIKTAKKSPPKNASDGMHWLQLTCYALGLEVEDGVLPQYTQIDTLVTLKGGIEHRTSRSTKDKYDFAALFNRLQSMGRALRSGIFVPASRSWWGCSEDWCEYFSTCPYVKNPTRFDLAIPSQRLYKISPAVKPESTFNPPAHILQMQDREILRKETPCQTKSETNPSPTDSD